MALRVLCLGYSVTEQPGYVERANALAAAEGRDIAFLKSGWGGHSLDSVAYMIDEILETQPCDFVLLELFTGDVRHFDRRQMITYLDEILATTARRGLPVAFLNLYQGGVDYGAEPVAGLLEEYRRLYGIVCLNIAPAVAAVAAGDLGYLLKDSTHVAPAGAELYGLLVYAFLRVPPPGDAYVESFRRLPRRFVSLPLRTLAGLERSAPNWTAAMSGRAYREAGSTTRPDTPPTPSFELRRHGIPLHFLEVPENQNVKIDLGRTYRVLGVMLVFGPVSGWMVFWNGRKTIGLCAYDSASYYNRAFMMPVSLARTRRFWAAQMDYLPDVKLRKGEASHASRVGRISHVFCRRRLHPSEVLHLLRHRIWHSAGLFRAGVRNMIRR